MRKIHVEVRTQLNEAGDREAELVVSREPVWTYLVHMAADWFCVLTRHRLGCTRLLRRPFDLSDRHTERFELPVTVPVAAEYLRWRGWSVWWEDDDED